MKRKKCKQNHFGSGVLLAFINKIVTRSHSFQFSSDFSIDFLNLGKIVTLGMFK